MIPLAFASRMGIYRNRLGDVPATVKLINNPSVLSQELSIFKTAFWRRVVGVEIDSEFRWLGICYVLLQLPGV